MKIKLPPEADLPKEEQPKCVIKIVAGDKFFISRSLNFEFIEVELRLLLKRYTLRQGIWDTNLYYPLIKHVVDKDIKEISIEVVFKSDSGYEILKEELHQLEMHFGKRNCLNFNNIPYIPKFKTPTSTNKWLTHNEFLNFKRLLRKYEY